MVLPVISASLLKVLMKQKIFLAYSKDVLKMIKNAVYFIVITLLVAELFKIYAN